MALSLSLWLLTGRHAAALKHWHPRQPCSPKQLVGEPTSKVRVTHWRSESTVCWAPVDSCGHRHFSTPNSCQLQGWLQVRPGTVPYSTALYSYSTSSRLVSLHCWPRNIDDQPTHTSHRRRRDVTYGCAILLLRRIRVGVCVRLLNKAWTLAWASKETRTRAREAGEEGCRWSTEESSPSLGQPWCDLQLW